MSIARDRPWAVPESPWLMRQVWHDVLFMHWPVDPATMRGLVPAALPLDTFDGQAWIGIVPFWMSGVRPRFVPSLPWLSRFAELNVRTYLTVDNKPGVYFFSLDAANPVAVEAARLGFGLPYFRARMSVARRGGWVEYASLRTHRGAPGATFRGRYRPSGPLLSNVEPGTLEWWLTARYCLYTVGRDGQARRLEIDHPTWELHPAEAQIAVNTMTAGLGLALPDRPPLLHYARRTEMVGWLSRRA